MIEVWKDIPEWEGLYMVSNLGRVKSLDRICRSKNNSTCIKKGKLLTPHTTLHGYLRVSMRYPSDKSRLRTIHRLVALAFIPNPENKREVNHIDGNKKNNLLSNLEWVTPSENQKHAFKIGLQIVNTKKCNELNRRFSNKEIIEIFNFSKLGKRNVDIAKIYKVRDSQISRILSRHNYKHVEVNNE